MLSDYYVAFGKADANVDSKGRVFIPSRFGLSSEDELVCFPKDNYYLMVILKWLQEKLSELTELKSKTDNPELAREIGNQLNMLYNSVIGQSISIDSQRRVVLPIEIRSQITGPIKLLGQGNKIAVFPNSEAYEQYVSQIEGDTPLVLK